jgi:hypothetical protein
MISPLMKLRLKNLRGKAFRFGIFCNPGRTEKNCAFAVVWQWKLAGSRYRGAICRKAAGGGYRAPVPSELFYR